MMLLSSLTNQIERLEFGQGRWVDIEVFSRVASGPLPLLRTLTIAEDDDDPIPPSQLLFRNAMNLKAFRFSSNAEWSPFFNHFVFPNLVSFNLEARPRMFRVSQLLDFLEASPLLRKVWVHITADMSFDGVAEEWVVVLPSAENISLIVDGKVPSYKIATHISCPSARRTSPADTRFVIHNTDDKLFPDSASWNTIVHQHSISPVEEAVLEITGCNVIRYCRLVFLSPTLDATAALSHLDLSLTAPFETNEWSCNRILTEAIRTLRNHPRVGNLKRLRISHRFPPYPGSTHAEREIGRLFRSLGPLDKLTIHGSNLRSYLPPFIDSEEDTIVTNLESIVLPPVKELTISHPEVLSANECTGIVELAKSHHTRGIPFERLTIREEHIPGMWLKERLRIWVGDVEFYPIAEKYDDDYYSF